MKRMLNTLYVTTSGAYVHREGETVSIRIDDEVKLRVPIHTLGSLVCMGHIMCSPPLLHLCAERGVCVVFLSENGRFLARVEGPVSGNILLRRQQYRLADDPDASAALARSFTLGKIANGRVALLRAAREHNDSGAAEALARTAAELARIIQRLETPATLDTVRGLEGDAANAYFGVFDHLIRAQRQAFFFRGRNRRPPLDNVNALLSFLYTLVLHDCRAALETVGLDPAAGFLHRDRPGRPSLALDLMEEFRAFLADRLALTLINRQQVKAKGFKARESGAVTMDDKTRKEVITAYQTRKQETLKHPFLDETVSIGLLPLLQARLLARHIRGDHDGYPPFLWR